MVENGVGPLIPVRVGDGGSAVPSCRSTARWTATAAPMAASALVKPATSPAPADVTPRAM